MHYKGKWVIHFLFIFFLLPQSIIFLPEAVVKAHTALSMKNTILISHPQPLQRQS